MRTRTRTRTRTRNCQSHFPNSSIAQVQNYQPIVWNPKNPISGFSAMPRNMTGARNPRATVLGNKDDAAQHCRAFTAKPAIGLSDRCKQSAYLTDSGDS